MKKLTFLTLAAALAFAAAPAFAAQPNGTPVPNTNSKSNGSEVGEASSALIQNGQFVKAQAQSGDRSDLVHQCQAGLIC